MGLLYTNTFCTYKPLHTHILLILEHLQQEIKIQNIHQSLSISNLVTENKKKPTYAWKQTKRERKSSHEFKQKRNETNEKCENLQCESKLWKE